MWSVFSALSRLHSLMHKSCKIGQGEKSLARQHVQKDYTVMPSAQSEGVTKLKNRR